MKKAKKLFSKGLAFAMAAAICVSAAGCFEKSEKQKEQDFISTLGGVSETYRGAVSDESYVSAKAAATAFVQQEVVGNQSANVLSTKSDGELSQTQINDLIPAELRNGVESVEKMQVQYTTGTTSYTSTGSETKTVIVYVIKYPTDWKY